MFKNLKQESKTTSNQLSKVGRIRPKESRHEGDKLRKLDLSNNQGQES